MASVRGLDNNLFAEAWAPQDPAFLPEERPERQGKSTFNIANIQKPNYRPPDQYYSIAGLAEIGLDIETFDPELPKKGPGERRGKGYIVGIGIGPRNRVEYYPIATSQDVFKSRLIQFDKDKFIAQLRKDALDFSGYIYGANLIYDLIWLMVEYDIVFPNAKLRDVQIAECLIDENAFSFSLETLAQFYLQRGKKTNELLKNHGPGYIENMDKVDPGFAAEYCIEDIDLCFDIFDFQRVELDNEALWDIYELESKVTKVLLKFRKQGVRVDLNSVERAVEEVRKMQADAQSALNAAAGFQVEVWASESIAKAFDAKGLAYPTTKQGKPSFRKDWLEKQTDEFSSHIKEVRRYDKIAGTFLESYLLNDAIDGRIFGQFHQLRGDANGTVSGRFSSSNPNLQNIPVRDPILGPICRGAFIPEEGHLWGSADWSQIEYRLFVHYAYDTFKGKYGTDKAVEAYNSDKKADFHQKAADITGLSRSFAKNVNFGIVYGMGIKSLAETLNVNITKAQSILDEFKEHMPFGSMLLEKCSDYANDRGYIKTLLGRRRHFYMYEAEIRTQKAGAVSFYGRHEDFDPWRLKVIEDFGFEGFNKGLQRAKLHSALNSLLQGSAADLMKLAMVNMDEGGIFDVVLPHLTVHDELDVSVPQTTEGEEAFKELVHMMEVAKTLHVPVFADASTGANWSEAK